MIIFSLSDAAGINETHFESFLPRLCCEDGSEFLFLANSEKEMEDWVNKIQFHAQLPPSLQLLSYDDSQKVGI